MPVMFVYLLKINLALLLFCAGYYMVLRHLTFYTLNRIYLVAAILFASVYPQINLTGFAQRHQQMARPVQAIIYHWQAPAEKLMEPLAKPDYWQWAEIAFWAGAALLAARLLVQLYSLRKLYRNSKASRIFNHEVRLIKGEGGPFSFLRSIYVNPERHEPAELKAILLHEQVHVNEWHTLDILLAELSTIFYWFNPGIWLMKKAIRENVEFITDQKILNKGIDSKQYQYSLVNVSFSASTNTIVNHFNISTIKKRIIMMNTKRSSGINLTRYALLIPALVALLLVFSISKAELITKSSNALTALKLTISKNDLFVNNPLLKITGKAKNAKVAAAKTNDTIRNGGTFISTRDGDSIQFVINGIKADKSAFRALNPKTINSIEAVPADEANKILDQPDNKNTVFFVTTSDSEAGKKFREKLDKLTNTSVNINRDGLATSYSSNSPGQSFSAISDNIDSNKITMTASKVIFVKTNPRLTLVGATNARLDTLVLNKNKNISIARISGTGVSSTIPDSIEVYGTEVTKTTNASGVQVYTVGKSKASHKIALSVLQGHTANASDFTPVTVSGFYSDHVTDINNIQSKMIMIDGKEASENDMKKLPASDIQSLSIKSGNEIVKKYGDKAKNGVVFITTRKS